ncbi:hypothetical protein FH972_026091 [Carpinus fangiana]|uniref:NADP-dependent oxidoreductase domain-containing protein n=1 Tax=Carpinus fangiana TaxID=176857 RepID=A0A5N6L2Y1_9ROSI|nr:hypothetical protein FH972_026091 [Carpinus fangiana]
MSSTAASIFASAPEPKTALGRHRILSPSAGIKVSPLCLGAMNFGEAWKDFMGECTKETTFEMLDFFYENGGNFIDTANNYQNEESEIWIGEWLEKRGVRDEMVIATKYTTLYTHGTKKLQGNYVGNSSKSMHLSLEASLKKLQTSYLDILYLHWWDFTTSVEEVMQAANNLVRAGKVLYLGVSDTPAWVVAKANMYARQHGLAQFVIYQGRWSASNRDFESDILPMCQDFGMAMAPWGSLGGGHFKTEEQRKSTEGRKFGEARPVDIKVSEVLEKIAKKKGTILTSVALAYVVHTSANVFPIVGGRKIEHLKGNIEALKLRLSQEEIKEIESASGYEYQFPLSFLFNGSEPSTRLNASDVFLTKPAVVLDIPPNPQSAFPPQ